MCDECRAGRNGVPVFVNRTLLRRRKGKKRCTMAALFVIRLIIISQSGGTVIGF